MKWDIPRIAEAAIGIYLVLPSVEDAATGGATVLPSAMLGGAMVAHAFGFKF